MSEVVNLGSIFNRFSSGKTIKSSDIFEVGEYPVFGGNGIRGFCDFYNFEGECLIIGRQGANCGNVRYFSGKAYMTEHAIIGVANEHQNVGYIANKLSLMKLEQFQGQSAQPGLSVQTLSEIPIQVPEKSVQDKVFSLLSILDQKIAINNQINEELEAMAKTLYDYWFVQFDSPDENGKPYKSSGGKMVYNDQLKREIPEGWGVKLLGELSTYVTDKISSNDLNSKNYIGTDNMLSNMKGIEQATYLPNSTLVNSFIPNDILIANIRPYFKKIWISDRTGGCSSDVLCLRANDKEICNYLFYSLARDDFFNYNVAGSKGSKMPRGDKAHIQKYSVLFSEKHALKFSKLVSNFISQKHLIYKQNQELSQLRDWLLPMLMNGQVKVE